MNRWLRVVLPDWPAWMLVICAWQVVTIAFRWWIWRRFEILPERLEEQYFLVVVAVVVYAIYRIVAFHPLWRTEYRQWLERTPWTPSHPLPLGPLHLTLQDGVWLSVLTVIALFPATVWGMTADYLWLVWKVFGLVFLFEHAKTLRMTGDLLHSYAVGFLLGLVAYAWPSHMLCLGLEVLTYLVVYRGVRLALERFPWDLEMWEQTKRQLLSSQREPSQNHQNGWPFLAAGPVLPQEALFPRGDLIGFSLLSGWWTHVANRLLLQSQDGMNEYAISPPVLMLVASVTLLLPAARVVVYFQEHRPPLGFWGRVFTFRWMIPRYDVIFAAPLLALACGVTLPTIFAMFPLLRSQFGPVAIPVTTTLVMLITLGMGPRLRVWHFTGTHRIVVPPGHTRFSVRVG